MSAEECAFGAAGSSAVRTGTNPGHCRVEPVTQQAQTRKAFIDLKQPLLQFWVKNFTHLSATLSLDDGQKIHNFR